MTRPYKIVTGDIDETIKYRLDYRGAEIRLDQWRSRGYRTIKKSCEIRFPDGSVREMCIDSGRIRGIGPAHMPNSEIFRDAKESVREWLKKNPDFKPGAQQRLFAGEI